MTKLMERGPVPVDRLEIGVGPRHLDEVAASGVEGAFAADAEIGAGRRDQRLGLREDQPSGTGGGAVTNSPGRSSHWSVLNTVKRLRNGIAPGSSPSRSARCVPRRA